MGDAAEALAYEADVPARIKDDVAQHGEAAKGAVTDMVDNIKAAVDTASHAAADTSRRQLAALSQVKDSVSERVGQINGAIGDRVSELNVAVNDRLQGADVPGTARRAVGKIQENPIGLALVALSIGFLTGSLLPLSKIERERLEPLGSKIVDQAQATASDLVEASKTVVMETAQTAVNTALNSAQSHGQEVVDAAKARISES